MSHVSVILVNTMLSILQSTKYITLAFSKSNTISISSTPCFKLLAKNLTSSGSNYSLKKSTSNGAKLVWY